MPRTGRQALTDPPVVPSARPTASRTVHAFTLTDEAGRECAFDPRRTIETAARLRHAAHHLARLFIGDHAFVESYVCGHGTDVVEKNERFSYWPLPTVPANPNGDGSIRSVALVLPAGAPDERAELIARRLADCPLIDEHRRTIAAYLRPLAAPYDDERLIPYLGKSRRWASVTPLVLPGRDDRRAKKAARLIVKSLSQAGILADVADVELSDDPFVSGSSAACRYRVPSYLKAFPTTHAVITFDRVVSGPVVFGAGRHVGLGVFVAQP